MLKIILKKKEKRKNKGKNFRNGVVNCECCYRVVTRRKVKNNGRKTFLPDQNCGKVEHTFRRNTLKSFN